MPLVTKYWHLPYGNAQRAISYQLIQGEVGKAIYEHSRPDPTPPSTILL